MSDPDWQRVRTLFEQAVDLDGDERTAFLDRECGQDADLREAVGAMLAHDSSASAAFLEPPTIVHEAMPGMRLGDFVLQSELGRGSMGIVYRALQQSLQRHVAVKVLVEGFATTRSQLERFHREARATGRLTHGNIVPVFAEGQEGKTHWFAMELVEGHDLERELRLAAPDSEESRDAPLLARPGEPQHITEAVRIVAEIAEALAHAHEHGIVHRDVKPSNILIATDGSARLVDFGIARDQSYGTMTQVGQVIGSLPYMSPEQARLLDCVVDHRTDIYSAGVVLYELLSSQLPFGGSTSIEVLAHIRQGDPQPVRRLNRRVPRELALVCHQAIRPAPDSRYRSAAELAADLRRFLRHEAVLAAPPKVRERFGRWLRRHRLVVAVVASVLIAVTAGVLFERSNRNQQRSLDLARDIDGLPASLRTASASLEPWQQASVEDLRRAADIVERASDTSLPRPTARRVEQIAAGLNNYATSLSTTIDELEQALRNQQAVERNVRGRIVDEIVMHGVRRAALDPERIRELQDLLPPTIDVTLRGADEQPLAGTVRVAYLDERTGEPGRVLELGALPVRAARAELGFARIIVQTPGGTIFEHARMLELGGQVTIDEAVASDAGSTIGMVRIKGGTWTFDARRNPEDMTAAARNSPYAAGWSIADFWIDEAEVSNADYREYIDKHEDAEIPRYWKRIEAGSTQDDWPVTDLSWSQMCRFAEWRGKRLPTIGEWLWVARNGNERRDYPWADTALLESMPDTLATGFDAYLEHCVPVRARSDLASTEPARLFHLLGNVAEMTETPTVANVDGVWVQDSLSRFVLGFSWTARANRHSLRVQREWGIGQASRSPHFGFRCARSIPR